MTTQANCFDSAREFLKISGINQSESVLLDDEFVLNDPLTMFN